MTVWIVGRLTKWREPGVDGGASWHFQGVFDSEQAAIAACRDDTYWIAPIGLNESLPHETVAIPASFYPLAGKAE